MAGDVFSVTRTVEELSVVCWQEMVLSGTQAKVAWRCLRVAGAMPFMLVGVLASLTGRWRQWASALERAGHSVEGVLP